MIAYLGEDIGAGLIDQFALDRRDSYSKLHDLTYEHMLARHQAGTNPNPTRTQRQPAKECSAQTDMGKTTQSQYQAAVQNHDQLT